MTKRQISLEISLGLLFTVVAIGANRLTMGTAVRGLNFGLFVALIAWIVFYPVSHPIRRGIFPLYLAAIIVQIVHFLEESVTGFATAFPAIYGDSWSQTRFALFNIIWLVIMILAAFGVRRNMRFSLLIVWFTALVGGIGNGVLHLYLSYRSGAYFPGTIGALVGLPVGVALIVLLVSKANKNNLVEE